MIHFLDVNNPNRDLSDPNWISARAYHYQMKKRSISKKIPQQNPQKCKVFFFDGVERFEFVQIYDSNLKCHECNETGSYYIENQKKKIGICMFHLKLKYGSIHNIEKESCKLA